MSEEEDGIDLDVAIDGEADDSDFFMIDPMSVTVDQSEHSTIPFSNFPEEKVTLLHTKHGCISKGIHVFRKQSKACLDVERNLENAAVMLNVQSSSLDHIADLLLEEMLSDEQIENVIKDAKNAIFTPDKVHQPAETIQGTCPTHTGGIDFDQSWICCFCSVPSVRKRHIGIARLKKLANFGRTSQEVKFVILVINPAEKETESELETPSNFAFMFADIELRQQLMSASNSGEFVEHLLHYAQYGIAADIEEVPAMPSLFEFSELPNYKLPFGKGIACDLKRRIKFYFSDYRDGFVGKGTKERTLAATMFLYFACLLPSIAFGVLHDKTTKGFIDVQKVVFAQCFGGLTYAVFSGQPLIIILTSAPIALYTEVLFIISVSNNVNFHAMYCCVGLWNTLFLFLYAAFDLSKVMKWSTRSTEDIFGLFVSVAFTVDAVKDVYLNFEEEYHCHANATGGENYGNISTYITENCQRENSILYLLLVLGTISIAMGLNNFTKTPYLNAKKREILSDYDLALAVLLMSILGSVVFHEIKLKPFNYKNSDIFVVAPLLKLDWIDTIASIALGFILSLLLFMDQSFTAVTIQSASNRLKKGSSFHWDLMLLGIINGVHSVFGLPWITGTIPHSPLHLNHLADTEEQVAQGHVRTRIVHVRETRISAVVANIMIGLSLFLLPYPLSYIPQAVLSGVFLFIGFTALDVNQLFERIALLIIDTAAYPPNHYIRTVPKRSIYLFTFLQLLQLAVLLAVGFSPDPYLTMAFPLVLIAMLPIRRKLIPKVIPNEYLETLDIAL